MNSQQASPPPLRYIPWFWHFFGLGRSLVLSAVVLVVVIDYSNMLYARLGDTIEFHRSIVLNCATLTSKTARDVDRAPQVITMHRMTEQAS